MRDHLFRRLFHATLPLLVWAAQFIVSYALVAAQCSPNGFAPGAPKEWMLGLVAGVAFAICLVLLWRARRILRDAGDRTSLFDWAIAGNAVLALAAIAWTGVPVVLITGCG